MLPRSAVRGFRECIAECRRLDFQTEKPTARTETVLVRTGRPAQECLQQGESSIKGAHLSLCSYRTPKPPFTTNPLPFQNKAEAMIYSKGMLE